MYELSYRDEVEWRQLGGSEDLPPPPPDRPVEGAALLWWEEHCIECAIPHCYTTCPLYRGRRDGRCARFAYGIYPNRGVDGLHGYGADIHFRRWAKLETVWPVQPALRSPRVLSRRAALINGLERAVETVVSFLDRAWVGPRLRGKFKAVRRRWAARAAEATGQARMPDGFYVKFYSPGDRRGHLHLEVVGEAPLYGRRLEIGPGWNEHYIPVAELAHLFGGSAKLLRVWVDGDREMRLVFTWLDLVRLSRGADAGAGMGPAEKVKCVAWDLDNTLWAGLIGEEGGDGVRLYPGRPELIQRLDERGILQTVASKNDYAVAWAHLERLGLADYFLFPAIHWGPKSGSLGQVAKALNIGLDSLAFVDDSAFERAEVAQALPQVRVYEPEQLETLLDRDEFDVPATEESRTRRIKYRAEAQRQRILGEWSEDYETFLRSCQLVMSVGAPREEHWDRCLELVNRSNQFNLSGRRYTMEELRAAGDGADHEALALKVSDQHGDYGLVGFAVFHQRGRDADLVEFVMSCRVAQKMVEETFLLWYAQRLRQRAGRLRAVVRVTDRNAPLRQSLAQIGFVEGAEEGELRGLSLSAKGEIAVPDVIEIRTL